MRVTYYGHSCISVQLGGKKVLFDPFIRPNPKAKGINFDEIKPDVILISHGHGDHIADAVDLAGQKDALTVSNPEIAEWLRNKGVKNTVELNIGGARKFEWGTVKMVTALHSSAMPDGTYGGNPSGFVVESAEGNMYFSGDTGLTYDLRLIGESYKLNFAALCIGDNYTMGAEDAVKCAGFVNCDRILGIHYNTLPPITIDTDSAKNIFRNAGKELILMEIGEERQI